MSKTTFKQLGIFVLLLFLISGRTSKNWGMEYDSSPPNQPGFIDSWHFWNKDLSFCGQSIYVVNNQSVPFSFDFFHSIFSDRFSNFKSNSLFHNISLSQNDSKASNSEQKSEDSAESMESESPDHFSAEESKVESEISKSKKLEDSDSSLKTESATDMASKKISILSFEEKMLAEVVPEKETKKTAAPKKWIPNLRVLAGSPPTILDLCDSIAKFDLEGSFGTPGTLQPELLTISMVSPSDQSVLEPEIQGTNLILNWAAKGNAQTEVVVRIEYPDCLPVYLSFNAEIWQPNYFWMIAVVIGGLGLFLIGMRNMSEGVQMMAGSSLRRLIAFFTENRFLAVGIGLLTTMLIQSSSVTTVMVVGFINSQIMTLSQGIGVIMGANIGTTVTGWILALKIEDYGLPLLGISAFFYLFSANVRVRYVSMSLMGLGLIFFGLKTMQSGFFILKDIPNFSQWMSYVDATSFFGVIKCACLGCLMTLVLQSSSATIGITISLATIGVIDFNTAAAFVLGENVGTTITALLASIGTTTVAKRAAYFHVIFNIIGVCWVLVIFLPILLPLVTSMANVQGEKNIAAGIALTHTLFNVSNTILFLPFTKVFASLLTRFVKESEVPKDSKLMLTSLGIRNMETPIIAIERSRVEILRMMNGCIQLNDWIRKIIDEKDYDNKELIEQAFKQEDVLDHMQDEVITFLADMMSKNLSVDIAEMARGQLRMSDELETVSDYLISVLKSNLKLHETGLQFPEMEMDSFTELDNSVRDHLIMIRKSYTERDSGTDVLQDIYQRRKGFTFRVKQTRDRFLKRMSEEKIDPLVVVAFNSQLNFYRRLREHAQNIAEAMTNIR
ncbi:MAG: Na/Pi cotransporter family protein [Planctomycetia bacterium]|nr:Na/Pi cotransporter family protein [Planctomycetia bacterium]